ncbi:type II toxin-antitoxin system VapC family toxin [Luteolibacter sp. GHJ8]|jgi:predicted nucleic-acid-binding protein|uniref:Type II toxin-antitoxin system VapC family toxin n=1 Tax=Luteolibacter rhizosphaerae TaxID=2989719 RepID=A0ABT3G202_9BACT|nr:type II toxin-antitoxin system VapC family toxin [Luteolibacter rhizosphaerae]MCW1913614.1 type II toxin-antitoxin system VapC family toxin [Luteolibacter rhizosphaerae]
MTALDTNVIVRYLTQDDEEQFTKVLKLLSKPKAVFFVCDIVLVETDWVLRELYDWSGNDVAEAYSRLATIPNLIFESESRLRSALKAVRDGADLSDELIVRSSREQGAKELCTFDKGILKRHKTFARLP